MDLTQELFKLADGDYADFSSRLIPTVGRERVIGVRLPMIRALAKSVEGTPEAEAFTATLPHIYLEEYLLHGALICAEKRDAEMLISRLDEFLPYVDNWEVCDTLSPKLFKKGHPEVWEAVKRWLKSKHTYTIRFGVVTLLGFYLGDLYAPEVLALAAAAANGDYYVDMAVAWLFSTALVKQRGDALRYLEERRLPAQVHNMSVKKARESYRVDNETKNYLKSLIIKE